MTGTPRWVKISGVVAAVLIAAAIAVALLTEGHTPSRHLGGGNDEPRVHTGPPPGVEH